MAFKRNWVHIYLSFFVTFLPPNIHHSKKSHKIKNYLPHSIIYYRATYVIKKNKTSIVKLLLTANEKKIIVFSPGAMKIKVYYALHKLAKTTYLYINSL